MLTLCQHNQNQPIAYHRRGDPAGEQGNKAYYRLIPEPLQPLSDICPQANWLSRAVFLEPRLYEEQRKNRSGVGDCIRQKWNKSSDTIECATQRRAKQARCRVNQHILSRSNRKLLLWHHTRQTGGLRQIEESKQCALDQRNQVELHNRQMAEYERDRNTAQSQRSTTITQNHNAFALPVIDQRTGGQDEERIGQSSQCGD